MHTPSTDDRNRTIARLLITCADRPGIVAAVSQFIFSHGANITQLDQHSTDPEGGTLFMRLEFQTPHLDLGREALMAAFRTVVAEPFQMQWSIQYAWPPKRLAVMVSRHEHCLMELLWRFSRGELPCEIAMVISNHPDLREAVERFGVAFHHVEVPPLDAEGKALAERRALELMEGTADGVVLARYMQILSPDFIASAPGRIINIHHSFLPAFAGADPYRQAFTRGVKLIGATAHYVTEELDAGPIIAQDVAHVSHRHGVEDLKDMGRDLERQVLARAVRAHLEDRVIVHGNKTVVF
ncbi:formyltetrahydrofolate deformylase [Fundidesulfovibrio terrae]|uniref:formyltetrahydrofolate deformylase n=1 Tax=Fundidesulfovibrio terrae TaxID=2922866 RepID=UPI001FAFBB2D|nr:formyltetrahydrofolate deformylase [Fundidesulfovibrio terrae]